MSTFLNIISPKILLEGAVLTVELKNALILPLMEFANHQNEVLEKVFLFVYLTNGTNYTAEGTITINNKVLPVELGLYPANREHIEEWHRWLSTLESLDRYKKSAGTPPGYVINAFNHGAPPPVFLGIDIYYMKANIH